MSKTIPPLLLLHGGAGVVQRRRLSTAKVAEFTAALTAIAGSGLGVLSAGGTAVDAVAASVRLLEDNPLFNAGKGSVLTSAESHELDAAIMNGKDKSAGAVTCVSRLKNPVLAAQAVMLHSPHVCFSGAGAEAFARQQQLDFVEPDYFTTPQRLQQLYTAKAEGKIVLDHDGENSLSMTTTTTAAGANGDTNPIREKDKFGTVGAVALDSYGNLAAATSTGGLTNKSVGRVGDTPIVGAGCYADDICAVSCTGTGEMFMRGVIAHDVAARMRYAGETLQQAADNAIHETLSSIGGAGGLIAIDSAGNFALPLNTAGMYRAIARADEAVIAKIFADD